MKEIKYMSKKRKIKIPLWLIIVIAEILVCVILFACGFKIVYAPEIANDWDAIEAIVLPLLSRLRQLVHKQQSQISQYTS